MQVAGAQHAYAAATAARGQAGAPLADAGSPPRGAGDAKSREQRELDDPNERSDLARWAVGAAYLGGAIKGLTMDRGRLLAAFPHARDAGLTKKWALEFAWGKITNDVVPVSGGVIAFRGKQLVTNSWGKAYAASNTMSMGLHVVGMLYGIPNLVDGIQKDGVQGLVSTRPGRTGALATTGLAIDLGLMGAALLMLPKGGRSYSALMQTKWLSNTGVVFGKAALGIPIMANELGFLDFLNKGYDRGVRETVGTASKHLGSKLVGFPGAVGDRFSGVIPD